METKGGMRGHSTFPPPPEKWKKSVIFGNFFDFCPLKYAFCPLNAHPPKIFWCRHWTWSATCRSILVFDFLTVSVNFTQNFLNNNVYVVLNPSSTRIPPKYHNVKRSNNFNRSRHYFSYELYRGGMGGGEGGEGGEGGWEERGEGGGRREEGGGGRMQSLPLSIPTFLSTTVHVAILTHNHQ